MAKNGKTSTLEVKNEIHKLVPGCGLTQTETSKLMNELFLENNWDRNYSGQYFEYKTNSLSTVATTSTTTIPNANPNFKIGDTVTITNKPLFWSSFLNGKNPMQENFPFTGIVTAVDNSTINVDNFGFDLEDLEKTKNIKIVSNASVTTNTVATSTPAVNPSDLTVLDGILNIGKLTDYSTALLKNFKNVYVCSTDKIVPHLYNTEDRFEARKLFKKETNAPHNDVRMKRLSSYLKAMGL